MSAAVTSLTNPPYLRWRRSFAAFGASRLKVWLDHLLYSVIWFGRRHDLRQLLAFDDHLDLLSIQHFALDQRERNSDQHIPVGRQEFLGGVVTPFDQFLNFFVDLDRGGLAVIAMLRNLAAQEDLLFLFAEGERAWFLFCMLRLTPRAI